MASMITVRVLGALKKGASKLVAKKAANGPPFFCAWDVNYAVAL